MKINFILSILVMAILLGSCSKDDDLEKLSGKYLLTSLTFSNCDQGDDNPSFEREGDEICVEVDDEKSCVALCMDFTEVDVTFSFVATVDGAEALNFSESLPIEEQVDLTSFCMIDGVLECQGIDISDDFKTITLSGVEDGCTITYILERQ